jgi:hypothetical protein
MVPWLLDISNVHVFDIQISWKVAVQRHKISMTILDKGHSGAIFFRVQNVLLEGLAVNMLSMLPYWNHGADVPFQF